MKKVIVLVSGYCPPTQVDEQIARAKVAETFDAIARAHPGAQIEVVSGLTNDGVMVHAYEEGQKRGWRLVGYACLKAARFEKFPVAEEHIVGANWGDESDAFISHAIDSGYPFYMVNVAGGKQADLETEKVRQAGGVVYYFPLKRH